MDTKTIRANSIVISITIRSVSGTKVLRKEDFIKASGELPPEELVKYGEKHIYPPRLLNEHRRIRKATERYCLEHGTRFAGAFMFDRNLSDEVCEKLDTLIAEYDVATGLFIREYPKALVAWAEKFPEYEQVIIAAADTQASLRERIYFDYMVYTIDGVDVAASNRASASIERGFTGLYGQVVDEVCKMMKDLITKPIDADKRRVDHRTLEPFRKARDKFKSLAFIDQRFAHMTNYIGQILARMPDEGPIEGEQRLMLSTTYQALKDPASIRGLIDSLAE